MAKRNIKFDLDFEQKDILSKFSIKQFDNALINISTYSEGKELNPVGNTCKLYVSVGNEVFLQNNGIRVLENTIEIDLDKNIVSSHGKALGELELTDSNGVFTSTTFIFDIDSKVGEGSTLPNGVEGFITKHERLIREFKNEINPKVEKLQSDINKSNNEINVINSELKQIERKNIEQDTRLKDVEYKNKVQDVYVKGLFNENNDKRLSIEGKGNSIKLEGSKKGLVTVDKVIGNTLVNIDIGGKFQKYSDTIIFRNGSESYLGLMKPSTVYTLFINYIPQGANRFKYSNCEHSPVSLVQGKSVYTLTTPSEINNNVKNPHIYGATGTVFTEEDANKVQIMLFEGDISVPPIDVFEGLQSTFENKLITQEMVDSEEELAENLGKYKCEVKVRGKNLFDGNWEYGSINDSTGSLTNASNEIRSVNFIKVYPGQKLCFTCESSKNIAIRLYDINRKYIGATEILIPSGTVVSGNAREIPENAYYMKVKLIETNLDLKLQIEEGTQVTPYESYLSRTQTVYLNSPLLKGDELVCREDGLYHHHKMGKVVFNGDEDEGWKLVIGSEKPNAPYYRYYTPLTDALPSSVCLNNRFKYLAGSSVEEEKCYITTNSNFTITKKDVSTLQEFKVWLQSNPVTVVYELAEPYHEKISDDKLLLEIPNSATLSVESVIPCTSISATYTGNVPSVYGLEETGITNTNDIAVTQTAVDFLLMSSMGAVMMMSFKNNTKGGNNMGAYFASRIMKKALKYEDVIRKYPEFKEDIDFILRSEGYGDLIVEL
ncbi:MAG: hypothetical protein DBY38_02220 [Clostridium cadaveris]|uniref:BppU N-terminal domain-containing protein n=1 Tax=Clostridium cadaveris TaxID=1529 RepID=A0A316M9Y2_9CLOT|nr:MAG: hypothetical protein DBY38_02220 [Clostridium cadaveris]